MTDQSVDIVDWLEAGCGPEFQLAAAEIKSLRARCAELKEALEYLINAATGMPISYDNLCQSTLDDAVEGARTALEKP